MPDFDKADPHQLFHPRLENLVKEGQHQNVKSETTLATHTVVQLLCPLLDFLRKQYPSYAFDVHEEVSLEFTVRQVPARTGLRSSDEPTPTYTGQARVDLLLTATPLLYPTLPQSPLVINVMEFKKPMTLHKEDFVTRLRHGYGCLRRNAKHLGKQSRKYMVAASWRLVTLFDGFGFVGLHVKREDFEGVGDECADRCRSFL
jgi:hypothetical protein